METYGDKPRVNLYVCGDAVATRNALFVDPSSTLQAFLKEWPCDVRPPADKKLLEMPLGALTIDVFEEDAPLTLDSSGEEAAKPASMFSGGQLDPENVVRLCYAPEIEQIASYLKKGLSTLVRCEKLVAERLGGHIATVAGLTAVRIDVDDRGPAGASGGNSAQRQLAAFRRAVADLKSDMVLILPHLDLLAGGGSGLSNEAREVAEILYALRGEGREDEALVLGFIDPSLEVPEVIAARFAVRIEAVGVPKILAGADGAVRPLGHVLVTSEEALHFTGYDPVALYKNVAGMNPIRLRNAIDYAVHAHKGASPVPAEKLYRSIRAFKAQTSASFEIPNVGFDEIGGYQDVKAELVDALRLMTESFDSLPSPELQRDLIPRGFLFHGPPGTGKTLFAKAIANALNATILVVSGPEVTDMYVGESERKIRSLFAEARRNAPSVLVFDEFDAIAAKRSGREDGGSRAGNAIVAQILTEMDGFRPDVPILVIGTTNQIGLIDPALLRPSRFRPVKIGLPDAIARRAIAMVHARKFGIECSTKVLDAITAATQGFNGDDIRAIFRDACVDIHVRKNAPGAHTLGKIVGSARHAKNTLAGETPAAAVTARSQRNIQARIVQSR